ncbi:MAG: hypothetical protein ABIS86_20555 [Streptosporangiaceae bacterium]
MVKYPSTPTVISARMTSVGFGLGLVDLADIGAELVDEGGFQRADVGLGSDELGAQAF